MLSRREFLAFGAAGAAMMVLPLDARRRGQSCVLVDLEERCALRESLLGYAARSPVIDARSFASIRMTGGVVIIPGAAHVDHSLAHTMLRCLQQGGTVLLESGAVFGDFRAHRDQLREYFDILLEPPVALWPARGIPYVDYTWPVAVKVRDFSRVIPLAPQQGSVIARAGDVPVALARRVGRGTLVVLGSPLGTALWAGDAEAKRWLGALLALGTTAQT